MDPRPAAEPLPLQRLTDSGVPLAGMEGELAVYPRLYTGDEVSFIDGNTEKPEKQLPPLWP